MRRQQPCDRQRDCVLGRWHDGDCVDALCRRLAPTFTLDEEALQRALRAALLREDVRLCGLPAHTPTLFRTRRPPERPARYYLGRRVGGE